MNNSKFGVNLSYCVAIGMVIGLVLDQFLWGLLGGVVVAILIPTSKKDEK
ncbi:hypothetical protein [Clostridium gasigenes]|nr:hypothetical protein [Clostridium gasigenes]MBU3107029.1 hypothetical protein [Clostridium gasigenes]